jgi:hypothetical protein
MSIKCKSVAEALAELGVEDAEFREELEFVEHNMERFGLLPFSEDFTAKLVLDEDNRVKHASFNKEEAYNPFAFDPRIHLQPSAFSLIRKIRGMDTPDLIRTTMHGVPEWEEWLSISTSRWGTDPLSAESVAKVTANIELELRSDTNG